MAERTVIDCYKELPGNKRIPDEVWDCYRAAEELARLDRERAKAHNELTISYNKMIKVLLVDWSVEEIDSAGLRDCV